MEINVFINLLFDSLAKRQPLKNHFEKFGQIVKLQINVERGTASVEFESHEQAANARQLGTIIGTQTIQIAFKKKLARTNSTGEI